MKNLFTTVVIVAAGRGKRMNMDINKQYIYILGKPMLARTIQNFEESEDINEIILVVNEDEMNFCKSNIVNKYNFKKVKFITNGGKERQNSVYNGIKESSKESDIIMVHDGARPFVSNKIIKDSVLDTSIFGATVTAVPVKDTIKYCDYDNYIDKTLDRSRLWSIQTPQTFKKDIIVESYKKAFEEGFLGTDDAGVVENNGYKVKIVEGDYFNIKITTKEDLVFANAILSNNN